MKIKGHQEDVAKELGFSRLTIWQPGALDRGELGAQRAKERCLCCLGMRGIDVALVARARTFVECIILSITVAHQNLG